MIDDEKSLEELREELEQVEEDREKWDELMDKKNEIQDLLDDIVESDLVERRLDEEKKGRVKMLKQMIGLTFYDLSELDHGLLHSKKYLENKIKEKEMEGEKNEV